MRAQWSGIPACGLRPPSPPLSAVTFALLRAVANTPPSSTLPAAAAPARAQHSHPLWILRLHHPCMAADLRSLANLQARCVGLVPGKSTASGCAGRGQGRRASGTRTGCACAIAACVFAEQAAAHFDFFWRPRLQMALTKHNAQILISQIISPDGSSFYSGAPGSSVNSDVTEPTRLKISQLMCCIMAKTITRAPGYCHKFMP